MTGILMNFLKELDVSSNRLVMKNILKVPPKLVIRRDIFLMIDLL